MSKWPWPYTSLEGHLLDIINLPGKFEVCMSKCSPDINRTEVQKLVCVEAHCDLDHWPNDLNINPDCLLIVVNTHAKFEVCIRSKGSPVIAGTSLTTDMTDRNVQSNTPQIIRIESLLPLCNTYCYSNQNYLC